MAHHDFDEAFEEAWIERAHPVNQVCQTVQLGWPVAAHRHLLMDCTERLYRNAISAFDLFEAHICRLALKRLSQLAEIRRQVLDSSQCRISWLILQNINRLEQICQDTDEWS